MIQGLCVDAEDHALHAQDHSRCRTNHGDDEVGGAFVIQLIAF